MNKNVLFTYKSEQEMSKFQGATLALGWNGYGDTLTESRPKEWAFRVYKSTPYAIASNPLDAYLTDSFSKNQVIFEIGKDWEEIIHFLKTKEIMEKTFDWKYVKQNPGVYEANLGISVLISLGNDIVLWATRPHDMAMADEDTWRKYRFTKSNKKLQWVVDNK